MLVCQNDVSILEGKDRIMQIIAKLIQLAILGYLTKMCSTDQLNANETHSTDVKFIQKIIVDALKKNGLTLNSRRAEKHQRLFPKCQIVLLSVA